MVKAIMILAEKELWLCFGYELYMYVGITDVSSSIGAIFALLIKTLIHCDLQLMCQKSMDQAN